MQCQSCGSNVKIGMKQCPTCGEEVTSAFTTNLPRKASQTGPVDYSSVMNSTNSDIRSNSVIPDSVAEVPLNGKQPESTPIPVPGSTPVSVPAARPAAPIMPAVAPPSMLGERRDATPQPADLLRTNGGNCRRCYRDLKVGAKFCSICGTSVDPSSFERAMSWARSAVKNALDSSATITEKSPLPLSTIILVSISALFGLIAIIQYLIPVEVDAGSSAPLIYHLRSIEYLLAALIFMVAALVFKKR
jgi:hypothetical protein